MTVYGRYNQVTLIRSIKEYKGPKFNSMQFTVEDTIMGCLQIKQSGLIELIIPELLDNYARIQCLYT